MYTPCNLLPSETSLPEVALFKAFESVIAEWPGDLHQADAVRMAILQGFLFVAAGSPAPHGLGAVARACVADLKAAGMDAAVREALGDRPIAPPSVGEQHDGYAREVLREHAKAIGKALREKSAVEGQDEVVALLRRTVLIWLRSS